MEVRVHKTWWTNWEGGSIESSTELAEIPDETKERREALCKLIGGVAETELMKGYLVAYDADQDFYKEPWNHWATKKGLRLKGTVIEL